jgi:hypothetical protein
MASMKNALLIIVVLFFSVVLCAQQPAVAPDWDAWKFLLGKWVGEGSSDIGQGSGYFTFEPDLQGRVLVRRNHAEYPAAKDRPAYAHDDLMVVFLDSATKQTQAVFFDNEGHSIHYAANLSQDGKKVTFLSDLQPGASRYRLIYVLTQPDHMSLTFEIAPPDKPEEFHTFIEGSVRKLADHK